MNDRMSFITSELMRTQVYHNHKENMAWVATALYISGMLIIGLRLNGISLCYQKVLIIVAALAITGLAFWFVCWQFGNRKRADSRARCLIEIAKKLFEDNKVIYFDNYFKFLLDQKSDPDTTKVISFSAMGIALAVFIILICC